MSRENVEVFKRVVAAFNRGDLRAVLELMDTDVQAVPLLGDVEGDYRGHAGVRRWWENLHDVFPDFVVEVVEVRDLGEVSLATLRYRAHVAESDTPVEAPLWMVARWRRETCVWWGAFAAEGEALRAAGLRD